jgi:ketosteroid isomerase-like protein
MSQENVDLVRKFIAPGVGNDYVHMFDDDAAWAALVPCLEPLVDPGFEGAQFAWGQQTNEWRGLEGLREAFREWLAPWSTYYDEIEAVLPVGEDRVLTLGHERGLRRDSGIEVTSEMGGIYTVRNGKIVRVAFYATRAEALETLGLSEQDAHAEP